MLIGIHFQPLMDIDEALSALRQLNKKLKCENPWKVKPMLHIDICIYYFHQNKKYIYIFNNFSWRVCDEAVKLPVGATFNFLTVPPGESKETCAPETKDNPGELSVPSRAASVVWRSALLCIFCCTVYGKIARRHKKEDVLLLQQK